MNKYLSSTRRVKALKFCYGQHQFIDHTLCDCNIICKMIYDVKNHTILHTNKFNKWASVNPDCFTRLKQMQRLHKINEFYIKNAVNPMHCYMLNSVQNPNYCTCSDKCDGQKSELELYFKKH